MERERERPVSIEVQSSQASNPPNLPRYHRYFVDGTAEFSQNLRRKWKHMELRVRSIDAVPGLTGRNGYSDADVHTGNRKDGKVIANDRALIVNDRGTRASWLTCISPI